MSDPRPIRSRRSFLGSLALAPLLPLASSCTAPRAASSVGGAPASGESPGADPDPYRALREQPLAAGAEPALTFRALAPRRSAR